MQRIYALSLLAWSLLKSLLRPLFGTRRGLKEFEQNFAGDRLGPMLESERAAMPRFSACIACGLCNTTAAARQVRARDERTGLMELVLAGARSRADFDSIVDLWEAPTDAELEEAEPLCPAQVPFRELREHVKRRAHEP